MVEGTRDKLLESALAVFSERGSEGGSMREIARRAGVNVATTYHHFGSKRDLLMAIFRERGLLDMPDPAGLSEWGMDEPEERLAMLLAGAWAVLSSNADVIRLALLEALGGDEEAREVFDAWREQGDAYIEAVVSELCDAAHGTDLAWVVRQVIWATLVEDLVGGPARHADRGELARRTARRLLSR